jgi:hypothetical protein
VVEKHTYRYHCLTSPVAYMSSIPIDPFQTSTPQRVKPDLGTIWDGGYVYDDTSRNRPHDGGIRPHVSVYRPQSGPALDWSLAHASYVNYYAMTNGLTSKGVIACWGQGGRYFKVDYGCLPACGREDVRAPGGRGENWF